MTLKEYINTFPRSQRAEVRKWLADQLNISEVYMRSMCSGSKRIHEKYALHIEKLTANLVPRYVTAPHMYPPEEYSRALNHHQGVK